MFCLTLKICSWHLILHENTGYGGKCSVPFGESPEERLLAEHVRRYLTPSDAGSSTEDQLQRPASAPPAPELLQPYSQQAASLALLQNSHDDNLMTLGVNTLNHRQNIDNNGLTRCAVSAAELPEMEKATSQSRPPLVKPKPRRSFGRRRTPQGSTPLRTDL
jgi:hypothetical protein